MRHIKRMFLLAMVVCALTAPFAATIVMPCMSTCTFPAITDKNLQPLGDPIDNPHPPGGYGGNST